ncbi:hypothetical protein SUGI_0307870 [Cryptomeria japonica]|nr:hypothetical protein SUGI_0307870 [Cryptomeria japonica]
MMLMFVLQYQFTPQHLVRLLQVIVDGNCDLTVPQVASIHFKNPIGKNWAPHEPSASIWTISMFYFNLFACDFLKLSNMKISPADKAIFRENLLQFIACVPPLLRAQFAEIHKSIINAYYLEQWPSLLPWVKHNLFKSEDERTPTYLIIDELEVAKQLFYPNIFNAWMVLFLAMLERPVPSQGQPTDPGQHKSWEWWKVKKWTMHIMNRLYTRFSISLCL